MTHSLEQQVAAALTDDALTLAELETLAGELADGIAAAKQHAIRERESAMDPARSSNLREARQNMDDAAIAIGRLQTLQSRLERKLTATFAAGQRARWEADYKKVLAKRDA